jgi:hypothetical protein
MKEDVRHHVCAVPLLLLGARVVSLCPDAFFALRLCVPIFCEERLK